MLHTFIVRLEHLAGLCCIVLLYCRFIHSFACVAVMQSELLLSGSNTFVLTGSNTCVLTLACS